MLKYKYVMSKKYIASLLYCCEDWATKQSKQTGSSVVLQPLSLYSIVDHSGLKVFKSTI